jgi:hypothetical protein
MSWEIVKLTTWEPNFRIGVIDTDYTIAQPDEFWNQLWYCIKKDVFPIRQVRDPVTKAVVWILCWNVDRCRVCANRFPTISDETEEKIDSLRVGYIQKWPREKQRLTGMHKADILSRIEWERVRQEYEVILRNQMQELGYKDTNYWI